MTVQSPRRLDGWGTNHVKTKTEAPVRMTLEGTTELSSSPFLRVD